MVLEVKKQESEETSNVRVTEVQFVKAICKVLLYGAARNSVGLNWHFQCVYVFLDLHSKGGISYLWCNSFFPYVRLVFQI